MTSKIDDPWGPIGPDPVQRIGRRIEGAHTLDVFWVRSSDGAPGLLLRGLERSAIPSVVPRPRGMAIVLGAMGEPPEAALYLQAPRDQDVFVAFCRDVISYSAQDQTARGATSRAFRRLEHWHSLLARRAPEEMGPQEIRGVFGELWVLLQLAGRIGIDAALQSWLAPDDHPQDFAVESGIIEVKTRLAGSRPQVHISSLEQLEGGAQPLHLMAVEVSPSEGAAGQSLNQIAQQVIEVAEVEGLATADRAGRALLHRGYMEREAYSLDRYAVPGARAFRVEEDFPRITRAGTDRRIPAVNYTLDLTALSPYERDLEAVWPEQRKQVDHG